jgi:SAM-dependent methyltransferase
MSSLDVNKQAEIASRTDEFMAGARPQPRGRFGRVPRGGDQVHKPFGWSPSYFTDWATITAMLDAVGVPKGARVLDLGVGTGWTSLFLAESGYDVVGYDLVPANVEVARKRAEVWGSSARFEVGDMEDLPPGRSADAALIFDSLHHCNRQREVLECTARRLAPGGWLLLGEPTWLHRFSPGAHAARRDLGWTERGPTLRSLRRDLRAAGFGEIRRFYQPTAPYEDRLRGFAWQLLRMVGANLLVAPGAHLWLAARRS